MLKIFRTFATLITLFINLILLGILIYSFFVNNHYYYIKYILQLAGIIFVISILLSNSEYYYKLLWISFIALQPLIGIVIYISLGSIYNKKEIYSDKVESDKLFNKYLINTPIKSNCCVDPYEQILLNLGKRNINKNSSQSLLMNGKEKFNSLFDEIKKAKVFIHMEYYIIDDSNILSSLINLLIIKAKEGVEIRILYDNIGSNISEKNLDLLRLNNIQIESFGKFKIPFFNNKINFRNHRKICVIDNKVGFLGGINIGDEYLGYTKKYGNWLDLHLKLEGNVLHDLHLAFLKDWFYVTKENYIKENYFKYFNLSNYKDNKSIDKEKNKKEYIQILNTGADNKDISIKNIYFKLITTATKEITIFTPYLVPDKDIMQALVTAAQNNVKIKLFMPGNPDKKIVYAVSHSYYQILLESNIRIFEIKDSFLHSKALFIDGEIASIGSINFDYRSFNLNFEITSISNSLSTIKKLEKISNLYERNSKQILLSTWSKRSLKYKIIENILQLFAPLF